MNQLRVDINGISYTDKICGISIEYEKTVLDATVFVDASDLVNHFKVTCDSRWIKIQRIRNLITIVVNKNCTLDNRVGVVEFIHNLDPNVFIKLNIAQSAAEYEIGVNQENIQFDTLLERIDENIEESEIIVTTTNGMCDFGIGPIAKYVKNIGEPDYYSVTYDNGLKITKLSNNRLKISNYGKVSLYDYTYYIITLYHINNPRSTVQIRVDYVDALENNQTGFDFSDDIQND